MGELHEGNSDGIDRQVEVTFPPLMHNSAFDVSDGDYMVETMGVMLLEMKLAL